MKPTEEHFEIFKVECAKWRDRLGLRDWDYVYFSKDVEDNVAFIIADSENRVVNFFFSTHDWEIDITPEVLNQVALHENLEILLKGVRDILSEFMSERVVSTEIHKIIRTLENTLLQT